MITIGITTYARDKEDRYSIPGLYLDAVRAAGGIPILLTPGETQVESLLSQVNGLLLAGGGDVNPDRYGSSGHAEVYAVDEAREARGDREPVMRPREGPGVRGAGPRRPRHRGRGGAPVGTVKA